jgi:hypothetical protein
MRPIKFRAWDTEFKKMFHDIVVFPGGMNFVRAVYDNRDVRAVEWRTEGAHRNPSSWEPLWIEGELMQFTGLLDKNGKEIYEGDIVAITSFEYGIERWEIRWSDINSGFWIGTYHPLNQGMAKLAGVIGSIYENPELIESAKK